jgi:hypothetical protein
VADGDNEAALAATMLATIVLLLLPLAVESEVKIDASCDDVRVMVEP